MGENDHIFQYCTGDAHALPFLADTVDILIANHMVYLLEDRPTAFREIQRVLRPGGRIYAATNPSDHMLLGWQLADEVHGRPIRTERAYAFGLEDGRGQLAPYFTDIGLEVYEDLLHVTDPNPAVDYVHSLGELTDERLSNLWRIFEEKLAKDGAIIFKKAHGLFRCSKGI